MTRLPESLGVLRSREFRLLFCGQAVSVLGDRMVAVALAFAVLEIGGSPSDVGLVLAAGVFPLVASVLVGGAVADRASRRAVMVVADLVRVASQGAMAALLIAGVAEVWMLALLAGVTGTATGFFSPASTGLLPEVVRAEQLQPANALRSSAVSAGEIVGPLACARAGSPFGRAGGCGPSSSTSRSIGVGALAGSVLATQVEPRRPLVFVALTDGLFALPLAFLAAGSSVPLLACGALLSGAGMMLGMSVWESTLQRRIPRESLSRVSSYDWFGSLAFSPLGLVIWGPVAATIGVSVSLWLAFGIAAANVLALLAVPDVRRLIATPAPA